MSCPKISNRVSFSLLVVLAIFVNSYVFKDYISMPAWNTIWRNQSILKQTITTIGGAKGIDIYNSLFLAGNTSRRSSLNVNSTALRGGTNQTMKKVLFWVPYCFTRYNCMRDGRQLFLDRKCHVNSCEITSNRSEFNNSHAVVFFIGKIKFLHQFPKYRFPWQYFVFYLKEAPMLFPDMYGFNGIFNFTQTYRLDSDLYGGYGRFIKRKTPATVHLIKGNNTNKTKLIAWFVSHCNTASKREKYAGELQKHIQVDVYGKCGNLTCKDRKECYVMLNNTYKFYLSFENSLCKDYVTEKLYNIFKLHVVPIVLGVFDYKKHLPEHSYIDIRDFDSPRHLADYLRLLDANDTLYNEYFNWKRYYDVDNSGITFCDLCEKLHAKEQVHRIHDDLGDWWSRRRDCNFPKQYYSGHGDIY